MGVFELPIRGRAPWARTKYSWAGWIPTVSGHLSFSLIGSHNAGSKCRTFNRTTSDNSSRVVAVHQQRSAQDFVVPSRLVRPLRKAISIDYLIVGRGGRARTPCFLPDSLGEIIDDQGVMRGFIAAVPNQVTRDKVLLRKDFLAQIGAMLDDRLTPAEEILDRLSGQMLRGRAAGIAVALMEFAIFRTGEFRLWYEIDGFFGFDTEANPLRPEEIKFAELLPAQAYFFAKDVAHLHFHHEPESDQLLPLTRLTEARTPADHDANELKWRRETLWGLARVVSQFRRQNTLYDHKKVLGVLAYADAFQSMLARIWRRPDLATPMAIHSRLPLYDFKHTRGSVEAMESLAAWRRSGRIQQFTILAGVVLSSLALWAAAIQIRPVMCAMARPAAIQASQICQPFPGWNSLRTVVWITEDPLLFTGALFVFGYALFVLIFKDLTFVPGHRLFRLTARAGRALSASIARGLRPFGSAADTLAHGMSLLIFAIGFAGFSLLAFWLLF